MRMAVAAALLLAAAGAQAGALTECGGATRAQAELMACLQSAKRLAAERMLESFLAIEQKFGRQPAEAAGGRSSALLRQSQRDFERYLQSHCLLAQQRAVGAAAGPAALACEVDQLRARAAALEVLAVNMAN